MTLQEMRCCDSLGFPRITEKQLKPMVEMLKRTGRLDTEPPKSAGKGIVIAGGGRYLSWAWVLCRHIRSLGCGLDIQVWYLGDVEMPRWAVPMFGKLGAETVDAFEVMRQHPYMQMSGWILKNYAIRHCPWERVLFLDADSFPVLNPQDFLDNELVRSAGAMMFSDVANHAKVAWAWIYCGLLPWEKEGEAGQYAVHKTIGWRGLNWALWMGEHAKIWFNLVHGDKDLTLLAFRVAQIPLIFSTENEWNPYGISQRWNGREWFRHSMAYKRGDGGPPFPHIPGLFEEWRALTLGKR